MRSAVEVLLRVPTSHAFVPAGDCERAAGVGVEWAGPEAVRRALAGARPRDPARRVFSLEELVGWGLAGVHGEAAPPPRAGLGVAARREALGRALGFGGCDARQLLRQLNVYGFSRDEVLSALGKLEEV